MNSRSHVVGAGVGCSALLIDGPVLSADPLALPPAVGSPRFPIAFLMTCPVNFGRFREPDSYETLPWCCVGFLKDACKHE